MAQRTPASTEDAALVLLDREQLLRRRSAKWQLYPPEVLAMWVAEMDFATAPVVRRAIERAVADECFGYAPADDATGLPEAAARWQREAYGFEVDASRVHLLPDVLKGVELAIDCFSPPGASIVLPTPAYMPFFELPSLVARPLVEVPMVDGATGPTLDLEAIDAAFRAGARAIILCHPYNPLGRSFGAEELDDLAEIVASHGARVVADEIHAPLTYSGRHVPYASRSAAAAHTLTLTSASKAWNLPGLKCAQAITSNDEDERRWSEIPRLRRHGASTLGIAASLAAYGEGRPWLDAALGQLDANRRLLGELLGEYLPEVRYQIPEATYLAWLDFSALGLASEPAAFFLEHARVAMNEGLTFGSPGRGCARLNFATSPALLEEAVRSMAAAL